MSSINAVEVDNDSLQVAGITSVNSGNSSDSDNDGLSDNQEVEPAGIEHEDIGIVSSEDDENSGDDDSGSIGFGDSINGRMPGDSGNDTEAKKPKEIVVVGSKAVEKTDSGVVIKGSKIKENYADTDHKDWIEILSTSVSDEEDLELYALATAATDENVEEIAINFGEIKMDYKQPAKLFGIINIEYTTTVVFDGEEIYPDEYGRVKVKFPWYRVFTKNQGDELKTELESGLSEIDSENYLERQQEAIQTMSNIMKTKHDTAKAAINNVR